MEEENERSKLENVKRAHFDLFIDLFALIKKKKGFVKAR
jgi:hypothetical protein